MNERQLERFLNKVDTNGLLNADGSRCWEWLGNKWAGYGRFYLAPKQRPFASHRVSYEHYVGLIPEGLQLDHLCRNPACVNPAHLEPVTNRDNFLRSNHPCAISYRSGVCKRGHSRTPENVKRNGACRPCAIEYKRAWDLSRKAQR